MAECRVSGPARSISPPCSQTCLPVALLVCDLALCTCLLHGQAASAPQVPVVASTTAFASYDVVSIKPNVSGSGSMRISARETTFQATNTSLKMLLISAYGTRDALISGLPKWTETARWDINAKIVDSAPTGASSKLSSEQGNELYRSKVRSILTERFHLAAHKETRILPIYELILTTGPLRFRKSEPLEEEHAGTNIHNREMTGTAIPLKAFAAFLSDQVGRTVVDKTALEGTYDFSLKWSADELAEATKDRSWRSPARNLYRSAGAAWPKTCARQGGFRSARGGCRRPARGGCILNFRRDISVPARTVILFVRPRLHSRNLLKSSRPCRRCAWRVNCKGAPQ